MSQEIGATQNSIEAMSKMIQDRMDRIDNYLRNVHPNSIGSKDRPVADSANLLANWSGLLDQQQTTLMSKIEWLAEKICSENAARMDAFEAKHDWDAIELGWQSRIGNMEAKIMAKFEVISNTQSLLILKFENAKVDDQQKGVEMDLMIEKIEQLTAMVERVGEQNAGVKNSLESLANRMEKVAQLEDHIDCLAGEIKEMRRTVSRLIRRDVSSEPEFDLDLI